MEPDESHLRLIARHDMSVRPRVTKVLKTLGNMGPPTRSYTPSKTASTSTSTQLNSIDSIAFLRVAPQFTDLLDPGQG